MFRVLSWLLAETSGFLTRLIAEFSRLLMPRCPSSCLSSLSKSSVSSTSAQSLSSSWSFWAHFHVSAHFNGMTTVPPKLQVSILPAVAAVFLAATAATLWPPASLVGLQLLTGGSRPIRPRFKASTPSHLTPRGPLWVLEQQSHGYFWRDLLPGSSSSRSTFFTSFWGYTRKSSSIKAGLWTSFGALVAVRLPPNPSHGFLWPHRWCMLQHFFL